MRFEKLAAVRAVLLLALLATLTGCGSSSYDALLGKRMTEIRNAAKFADFWGPTQLGDTPATIRVPQVFKNSYVEDSAHPEDGAKIAPERLQPPFLPLPGDKICYEATATGPDGKLPFYCYLATRPVGPGEAARLEADLAGQLKRELPQAGGWEAVEAPTPTGGTISWKRIEASGEQSFRFNDANNQNRLTEKKLPASFELWMHDAGQYVVLVGWRVPTSLEGEGVFGGINVQNVAPLTAGTLTVDGQG